MLFFDRWKCFCFLKQEYTNWSLDVTQRRVKSFRNFCRFFFFLLFTFLLLNNKFSVNFFRIEEQISLFCSLFFCIRKQKPTKKNCTGASAEISNGYQNKKIKYQSITLEPVSYQQQNTTLYITSIGVDNSLW